MTKLNKVYEEYQDSPEILNSIRNHKNRLSLNSTNKRPFIGSFYWLPTIDNKWILDTYFYQNYGDTRHERVWNLFVVPYLAELWDINVKNLRSRIKENYESLPRGIVMKNQDKFVIYHGGDFDKRGWMNKILKNFNIKNKEYEFTNMIHLSVSDRDKTKLSKVLNVRL